MSIRKYEYIRYNNNIHYNHLIVMSMIIMYKFIITTLIIVKSINKRMYESYFLYIDDTRIVHDVARTYITFISVI